MKWPLIVGCLVLCAGLVVVACSTSRAGYETARFSVLRQEGDYSLRDYPSLKVVATGMDQANQDKDDRFMRLFRYIDGGNAASQKVAMTTPVFMTTETSGSGTMGKMNFVVPATVAAAGAPAPTSDTVKLETLPARRCAVLRFRGITSPDLEKEKLALLRTWMGQQKMVATGEPFFAYYDPPWTPGPLRRNEVLVPVRP